MAQDSCRVQSAVRNLGILKRLLNKLRVATNARNRQNKLKEQAIALMQTKVKKYGLDEHKIILLPLIARAIVVFLLDLLLCTKHYMRPVIVTRVNDDGDLFQGSLRGINDSGLADFREFCETSGLVEYAQGQRGPQHLFPSYQRGHSNVANEEP